MIIAHYILLLALTFADTVDVCKFALSVSWLTNAQCLDSCREMVLGNQLATQFFEHCILGAFDVGF